jgi:hypothetical protein
MFKKYESDVGWFSTLSSCFIIILFILLMSSLSINLVYNKNMIQRAAAQTYTQNYSSNLLTNNTNIYSHEYAIHYDRGGGQIPTLRTSCTIYTKSLQPHQGQEIKKMVHDARFFDLPTNLLPKGDAADYVGYTITVEEEGKRKHTVETSAFTAPAELKTFIEYLNSQLSNPNGLCIGR